MHTWVFRYFFHGLVICGVAVVRSFICIISLLLGSGEKCIFAAKRAFSQSAACADEGPSLSSFNASSRWAGVVVFNCFRELLRANPALTLQPVEAGRFFLSSKLRLTAWLPNQRVVHTLIHLSKTKRNIHFPHSCIAQRQNKTFYQWWFSKS